MVESYTVKVSLRGGQREVRRDLQERDCLDPKCRGRMRYQEIKAYPFRLNGTQFKVQGLSAWRCSDCQTLHFLPSVRRKLDLQCQEVLELLHPN